MLVLGIESTCDETAASVVSNGTTILSNIVASQIDLQKEYGGVVPELACRRHIDLLIPVIQEALAEAKVSLEQIDLIAAAYGPGLIGAILIGLNGAKALALGAGKPFIGINHVEAHLYAALMSLANTPRFPAIGVVISGGHTALIHIQGIGEYRLIGQTVDDAIGEAFDKVARLLGLPYPGGPEVERLALDGDGTRYPFSSGRVKGRPLDFSFSGLKTAVLHAVKGSSQKGEQEILLSEQDRCHLAASFQKAAFSDLIKKARLAAAEYGAASIVVGGGVSNNRALRKMFAESIQHLPIYWPESGLSLDNAAMIAGLAYHQHEKRGADSLALQAAPRIPFIPFFANGLESELTP